MKAKISLITMICFLVFGCAGVGINIDENSKEAFVKISARVFAFKAAEKNTKLIEPAKVFCEAVINGNINEALLNTAKEFLLKEFQSDPLMMASLNDLLSLITVEGGSTYDNKLVKAAASGFYEGILLYQSSRGL